MKKYLSGFGAFLLWMFAGVASAQTTTATTTTPGIPNTGAGDVVTNAIVLSVAALLSVSAAAYLYYARNAV